MLAKTSAQWVAAMWLRRNAANPKSVWDRANPPPFGWASPAPGIDGSTPTPWRVAHADRALVLLKQMFPSNRDIYTDHHEKFRNKMAIWVGLRENRDREDHQNRLVGMFTALKDAGYPVVQRRGAFLIVDDLDRDVLRR
jgi:hypothetical protein